MRSFLISGSERGPTGVTGPHAYFVKTVITIQLGLIIAYAVHFKQTS